MIGISKAMDEYISKFIVSVLEKLKADEPDYELFETKLTISIPVMRVREPKSDDVPIFIETGPRGSPSGIAAIRFGYLLISYGDLSDLHSYNIGKLKEYIKENFKDLTKSLSDTGKLGFLIPPSELEFCK